MIDCPEQHVLVALADGALADEEHAALAAHLADCRDCAEIVAELARLLAPAAERPHPSVDLPERYTVLEKLGEGGMGRVYAVHDRELARDIAIKIMRPDIGSPEVAARLVRESRLMARVQHPGVVAVYDVGHHGEHVYVAMELIRGTTLSRWLRARPRTWRDVVGVIRRVAEGLAAAHAAGLVHRDIKPDNILVAEHAGEVTRVALGDFGVARAVNAELARRSQPDAAAPTGVTREGTVVGTPAYMAPEQLDAGTVDARSDVFSLGSTLWEALFGERPYPGRSVAEIRDAMRRGPPALPDRRHVVGAVPRWLVRAARAAIAPQVEERTPTVAAFIAMLDVERRARRRGVLAVGGASLVAVAAGALVAGAHAHRDDCSAASLVDGVWSSARRARVEHAFAALAPEFAHALGKSLDADASRWAEQWRLGRRAACHASGAERVRREGCLDRALAAFDANLAVWADADLATATALAGRPAPLPAIDACATPPAGAEPILPALAPTAAAIDRIQALDVAGHHTEAARALAAIEPDLARASQPTFVAFALFGAGQVLHDSGDLDRAAGALSRAQTAAAAIGDSRALVEIMLARVDLAIDSGDPRSAEAMLDGIASVARLEHVASTDDRIAVRRAQVELAGGRIPEGLAELERAIAHLRTEPDPTSERMLVGALMLRAQADDMIASPAALDDARHALADARSLTEHASGSDAPELGKIDGILATIESDSGHPDAARAADARALTVLRAAYGDDHLLVAKLLANRGLAELDAGDDAAARATLTDARARLVRAAGDDYPDLANVEHALGQLKLHVGNVAAAVAHLREAVTRFERAGETGPQLARTLVDLGAGEIAAGSAADAVAPLERAVGVLGDPGLASDRAQALLALAEALAASGHARDAATRAAELDTLLPQLPDDKDLADLRARRAALAKRLGR